MSLLPEHNNEEATVANDEPDSSPPLKLTGGQGLVAESNARRNEMLSESIQAATPSMTHVTKNKYCLTEVTN